MSGPCEVCYAAAGSEAAPLPAAEWECFKCHRRLCFLHNNHDCPNNAGGHVARLIITAAPLRFPQWEVKTPKVVYMKRWGDHDLPLPTYKTAGAAGLDLHARLKAGPSVLLHPGSRLVVGCGFALEIPPGWEGQVRPRSGMAKDYGIVAASGTIDSDYRGEVGMNLFNFGREAVRITHGDRVAQLVIAPAPQVQLVEVAELSETVRGANGFGSSGK